MSTLSSIRLIGIIKNVCQQVGLKTAQAKEKSCVMRFYVGLKRLAIFKVGANEIAALTSDRLTQNDVFMKYAEQY